MISLQCWTPFVWEQDRFGMLVPLLALPIKHPLGNLLFQSFLSTFAGLATFYLLARFAFKNTSYPWIGTVGAVSLLALTPAYYRFEYLIDTSYGIGLSLALWGLLLVESRNHGPAWPRLLGAIVLMALSHWVNSATGLFLGPFVLLRGLQPEGLPPRWDGSFLVQAKYLSSGRIKIMAGDLWKTGTFRALVVLAIGYEFGQLLISLCPYQPTTYTALSLWEWPGSWWQLLLQNGKSLEPPTWFVLMAIEAVVGMIALARSRQNRSWSAWWPASALLLSAVALWLLMGTRLWIKMNDHAFRYLFPSMLLAQTAVAGLAVSALRFPVPSRTKLRAGLAALATASLLISATWSYGVPSLAGVRRNIDRRCGALTEDLIAARCTCLAGDYWRVWIAVFHANLVLYERGDDRTIWGLTSRSMPSHALWADYPRDKIRAGVAFDDGFGDLWLKSYTFYWLDLIEIRHTIRVFRPAHAPKSDQ